MYLHPMLVQKPSFSLSRSQGMGAGDLERLGNLVGDFVNNAIQGAEEMLRKAVQSVVQIIGEVLKAVVQFIGACVGLVPWSEVLSSLAQVTKSISNLFIIINPSRYVFNVLNASELTRHSFQELDKFTGGMITDAVNISDLPFRALRGDAITKEELLRTALTAIKVAALITFGPGGAALNYAAAGALVGSWIGNEVCKYQEDKYKDACKVAFTAAGYITGGSYQQMLRDQAAVDAAYDRLAQEGASQGAYEAANQAADRIADKAFSDYLTEAVVSEAQRRGQAEVVKGLTRMCEQQNWVGDRECRILGRVLENYINSPADMAWEDFLAQEAARLGVSLILEEIFPRDSKEGRAIRREYVRVYLDVPTPIDVSEPGLVDQAPNPAGFLLIAGAAATILFMGAF
jgi:hypothetical protein